MLPPVQIVPQPVGSKIRLHKQGSSLLVIVPPVGFIPEMQPIVVFTVVWNLFIVFWTFSAFKASNSSFLFSLPFWAVGLFLAYVCLFCFYGQIRFSIENQNVHCAWFLFDKQMGRQKSIAKRDIRSLVFIRSHWFRDAEGDNKEKPAEFRINGKNKKKISLGGTGGAIKHEDEVYWLASEIRDWLDLPVLVVEHGR
jgi:hypothetical protein